MGSWLLSIFPKAFIEPLAHDIRAVHEPSMQGKLAWSRELARHGNRRGIDAGEALAFQTGEHVETTAFVKALKPLVAC